MRLMSITKLHLQLFKLVTGASIPKAAVIQSQTKTVILNCIEDQQPNQEEVNLLLAFHCSSSMSAPSYHLQRALTHLSYLSAY
jgi:hypothetical protein